MHRLALRSEEVRDTAAHLHAVAPREGAVFFLLEGARTASGVRLVARAPYIPRQNELEHAGEAVLKPGSQLISKMVSWANREKSGLLFIHSHPDPRFPAGFSDVDRGALHELGVVMPDLLDGPFAAAVVSPNGWVASLQSGDEWEPVDRITSAGRVLEVLDADVERLDDPIDDRQRRAIGNIQDIMMRTDIVIAGAGGLGSPLTETAHRMGLRTVRAIDAGRADTISNVRRVFGLRVRDLAYEPFKAEQIATHCNEIGIDGHVEGLALDVRSREALPHLLDADVILCGTDTHASRATLNAIAYAFHLPVIDCGVVPGLRLDGGLECLQGEIRIVGSELPCLFCMEAIDPRVVAEENLPGWKREALDREGYGTGSQAVAPSVAALTVAGAGWMACALIGLLDRHGDHRPSAYEFDALNGFAAAKPASRSKDCICGRMEGMGRRAPLGLR